MSGKANLTRLLIMLAIGLGMDCSGFAGQVIYVDADATGANDGTSWADAYNYLQDALADANSAEKPAEVRVAHGIYRPDRRMAEPSGTGDREATFQLIGGVAIRGGYAGFGEPDPNARDIEANETVLSGDLAGDDTDVNDPCDLLDEPTRAENSYHVVTCVRTDGTVVVDGFKVVAGNANGESWDSYDDGGGMYNTLMGKSVVSNCIFTENSAKWDGGGMCNRDSSVTVSNCTFSRNWATWNGGGMYNHATTGEVIDCTFSGNSAGKEGGGTCIDYYGQRVERCRFIGNSAEKGGGISNYDTAHTTVTNCIFVGNSAKEYGGGAFNGWNSRSSVMNCGFVANLADNGCALACSDLGYHRVEVTNSILWDGGDEIWNEDGSKIEISFSDVQGGQTGVYDPCEGLVWGAGNIDVAPLFADPNNGDYHLKSEAGRRTSASSAEPGAKEGRWTKDDVTSPCIDAGDMSSFLGLEPFPNGGVINMGAYGGTAEASKSYFGAPVCETIVAGDLNGDCKVDFLDLEVISFHWLDSGAPIRRIEIKDVRIIKGELLEHVDQATGEVWYEFEPIEEVEQVRVGDVFTITAEIRNFGGQTEHLYLSCYHWELHPEDHVEVVGPSRMGGCTGHLELERGESIVLYPLSRIRGFQAKVVGWVTMNMYVKDGLGHTFCEYPFRFDILPKQ